MNTILRRLASLRLTLALLFVLAALGALGTLDLLPQRLPPERYLADYGTLGRVILALGLDSFHTSALYRLLFAALVANLAACGGNRSVSGFREAFGAGAPDASERLIRPRGDAASRLRAAGFSLASETPLRGARRRWAFLSFPLVHLAPIPLVLAAFYGSAAGTIATQNISVGRLADTMYDWSKREDARMPFAVELRDLRLLRYPALVLHLQALVPGAPPAEFAAERGRAFPIPGTAFRGRVESFDFATGDMTYRIESAADSFGPFSRGREEGAPVRLRPLAFKEGDGDVRRAEALVRLFPADGGTPVEAVVAVNEPTRIGDYRVYLTSWGNDPEGHPYAGFQAVRSPGEGFVWAFSVLLSLGIVLLLFAEGAWVEERDGVLTGRSSRDRAHFRAWLREVAGGGGGAGSGGP